MDGNLATRNCGSSARSLFDSGSSPQEAERNGAENQLGHPYMMLPSEGVNEKRVKQGRLRAFYNISQQSVRTRNLKTLRTYFMDAAPPRRRIRRLKDHLFRLPNARRGERRKEGRKGAAIAAKCIRVLLGACGIWESLFLLHVNQPSLRQCHTCPGQ